MALRFWICTALVTFAPALLAAGECSTLNRRWNSRYHQAFGVEAKKQGFECVDDQKDFVIAQAIDDLYETDQEHNYYETARRLIHKLALVEKCDDRVAAFTKGSRVSLCDEFFKLPRMRRVAILFHEAAHGRPKDPGHVVCKAGEAKDKPTCDASLSDGYEGSGYNWEFHYARYLSQNSPDGELKRLALAHLKFLLDNRINGLNEQTKKTWLD